jgi:hypothetical protein
MADEVDDAPETGTTAPKPAASGTPAAGTTPAASTNPKGLAPGYPKFKKLWLDPNWNIVTASTPGAVEADILVTMTNDGFWREQVLDKGGGTPQAPAGKPYERPLKEGRDEAQAKAFDAELKRQGTTTTGTVDINGTKFQIATTKKADGTIVNSITNLVTGESVDRLPVDKSGSSAPKTVLQKGGDGKTYAVTVDAEGNLVGLPRDTGIPAETKEAQVFNVPGTGLIRVDGKGNSSLVYELPKDPNVKVEKDKNGRWVQITTDPKNGQTSVTYIRAQGVDAATSTPMGALPNDGEVTKWLWDENAKVDARVNAGELTQEEAVAEMDKRLKFANTLVAERAKQEAREDKDRDRGATLLGHIQPGIRESITAGNRMLPGEGSGEAAVNYTRVMRNQAMKLARMLGALPPAQPGVSRLAGPPPGAAVPVTPDNAAAPQGAPTAGEPGGPPLAAGPVLGDPAVAPATAPQPDPAAAAAAAAAGQPQGKPTPGEPGGPPLTPGPVLGDPATTTGHEVTRGSGIAPAPVGQEVIQGSGIAPAPQPSQYGDAGDTQMNRIQLDPDELAAIEEKYANGQPGQFSAEDAMRLAQRILSGGNQAPAFMPPGGGPMPAGSLDDFGGPGPLEGALDDIAGGDPSFAAALEEARRRSRGTIAA